MDARALVLAGDLQGALPVLQDQVRSDPADASLRVFLFELLSLLGDWERAGKQLNVAAGLDPEVLALESLYAELLVGEQLRNEVFAGVRTPLLFGEPEEWLAALIEAQKLAGDSRQAEALEAAFEGAPELAGTIDGNPFEWLGDADPRLGPVLEAFVNGSYYWIPMHRIRKIEIEEPKNLRDQAWLPANFVWENGGDSFGFVPTRYSGTVESGRDDLMASRATDWQACGELQFGLGQRMLATDVGDHPIMDVRVIEINPSD